VDVRVSTAAGTDARPDAAIYVGLGFVTAATLMLEIGLTRIFSVTMWYHFAFVAISLALFGTTAGALWVHLQPRRFPAAEVRAQCFRYALAFGVSVPVCLVALLAIPFTPRLTLGGVASVLATCALVAVPFTLAGVVVCLALTRFPARVHRLYAADLAGAAAGCLAIVAILGPLDGPSAIVAVGAVAATGAVAFAWAPDALRAQQLPRRLGAALFATAAIGGLALGNRLLHADSRPLIRIQWTKEARDRVHEYDTWNSFSRVTVDPWLFGQDLPRGTDSPQRNLVIDATAGTQLTRWDGSPAVPARLRREVHFLGHHLRGRGGDVAVIGVGGGRDVLAGIGFGARRIVGIEINPNVLRVTNRVYGDYTGNLDRRRGVTFVTEDGRAWLTRTDRRFDIIQISLIDTWAATAAGAFALSENALYTREAFATYLDRLAPGGLLSISRWYRLPGWDRPLETYRTVGLATRALTDRGVREPRRHLFIAADGGPGSRLSVATLLVSARPLRPGEVERLERVSRRFGFRPLLTPQRAADPVLADLAAPGGPEPALDRFREDLSPPDDDRPFFFQMADLRTALSSAILRDTLVTRPVLVLGLLALSVLTLAIGFIVVPIVRATDRSQHRGMAPHYVYFIGIGLGFLLVEIAQLQRLSVYLGHPTYALTVVLFTVLLAAGLGSTAVGRIARLEAPGTLLGVGGALLAVVGVTGWVTPAVIQATAALPTPGRITVAMALLAPAAFLMGMPFAIGMRTAARRPDAPTAFLWGINGAMSVCASVLAVVIALFFGIRAAYATGWAAYATAVGALVVIVARFDRPPAVLSPAPTPATPAAGAAGPGPR
jgi:SAM-dependent methyltransferase